MTRKHIEKLQRARRVLINEAGNLEQAIQTLRRQLQRTNKAILDNYNQYEGRPS
jgi:prefoldin subunit 5